MTATLFYDGQCPLCSKEINLLRNIQRGDLAFQDVHQLTEYTEASREKMLKMLHLKDADGNWHIGADATVMAWSFTRYGWLFKPLRWPVIGSIVDVAYNVWAQRRYYKLYQCGACQAIER